MKKVVTITGIRPDFIRMSEIFKKLDENFNHILVHTGQHYDKLLSDVFFDELKIRKPDYNLGIGAEGKTHYQQQADLSVKIIELLRDESIYPDIILFLGDSNSVLASVPLRKEGYKIGHIEAGMRSGDKRMFEEINRTICDHCSDLLFVYHEDYKQNCIRENISEENIFVVGNTIVEPCKPIAAALLKEEESINHILLDIHRPENFKDKIRLREIIQYAIMCQKKFNIPVKFLKFKRTFEYLKDFGIDFSELSVIDMMSYKKYLEETYYSAFVISDSGTAQEEAALLGVPVVVPRDFTERPQSVEAGCSYMLDVVDIESWKNSFEWVVLSLYNIMNTGWLGDGTTSDRIIGILKEKL